MHLLSTYGLVSDENLLRSVHGIMSQDTNDFLFASYTPQFHHG
jgi:hypothetical protein